MPVYLIVNAEHPWVALDAHTTNDNQWNRNNLGRRNSQQRENLSIKSYNNFGWKGEQDHLVWANLLLKTGLQNAVCTILLPNDLGNGWSRSPGNAMKLQHHQWWNDAATQVTARPNPSWGQDYLQLVMETVKRYKAIYND